MWFKMIEMIDCVELYVHVQLGTLQVFGPSPVFGREVRSRTKQLGSAGDAQFLFFFANSSGVLDIRVLIDWHVIMLVQ
jgi:hypothetical protein